ncbi:MAG TPA: metallophosphoesterase [Nitrososphaeraceae archaeon]|nr:metallophosphoesterase [Nitrososphaeraceae archaeon]
MLSPLIAGIIIVILLVVLIYPHNQQVFIQNSEALTSVPNLKESIKIVNPILNQKVSTGKELLISGKSSDSTAKDCLVSVIVNDVKPYQNAIASGQGGSDDYSQWKFMLSDEYTPLIEGKNKITAKLLCASAPTRWNGVFVNGVATYSNESILSPVQSGQQSNTSATNLSDIKNANSNSSDSTLLVSIFPQKNPVARGDSQNIAITVTDSNSKVVPEAHLDAKLIYPGGNYEKDFSGSTDADGKFEYSLTIGKNGDVGALSIEVDASSPAYKSGSVTDSFSLVDSSESSVINNLSYTSDIKKGISFVAAGDFYCDARTKKTAKAMQEKNPDLVLAVGDLSEVKKPDCFFDLFPRVDKAGKLKVVLGADDTDNVNDSSSRYNQYMRHFDLEEPFYSFDYKNIHFLAMATGTDILIPSALGSPQYNFVDNDLAQASNNENIDWIIVFGYRPFYSSPSAHPDSKSLKNTYPSLFDKYDIDLVLTGHNHNYQRTYPLMFNSERPGKPLIKDGNNTSVYENPGAPIYVTAGTAGAILHELNGQYPFIANQFSDIGFLQVNITNKDTEKHFQAAFHNSNNGTIMDHFSITKS